MTDAGGVDLNFIAKQNARLLEEMRSMRQEMRTVRDELRVNSAMVQRLNDAVVVQGRILDGIRHFMNAYADWKNKP
jgi:Ni,Fe-hydrogenase III large subunit